jgi:signal transduction histidine kinase
VRIPFSDLRVRLLFLVLIALVPGAGLYVYSALGHRAQDLERARVEALEQARQIARTQDYVIQASQGLLVALNEIVLPVDARSPCPSQLSALLRDMPYVRNLGVIALDGALLCSAVPPPRGAMNLSDRDWFQGALTTGGFFVGRYRVGAITGQGTITLSAPRRDASGRVRGVLFVALGLEALERLMAAVPLPSEAVITVFDRQGIVVARRPATGLIGKVAPESALVRTVFSRGEGTVESDGPDGQRRMYGFAPLRAGVQTAEIFVVVGRPVASAYATANRELAWNLSALGAVALVAIALAWLTGHFTVVRPIRTMVAVTHRIGEGDLEARVGPRYSSGELGKLGRALDASTTALAARTAALHHSARELEATVERRTSELQRANEELVRSNAELEQFAYVASHDLQEPLRMVSSYLELLQRRYGDRLDERAHVFIGYAVDGAVRMRTLINDLLAYSRVARRATERTPTDVTDCVREALLNLGVAIRESGAAVTHDPLPTVVGSPSLIATVFQNLIGNAIKFRRDEPPRVHVTADRDGAEWVFRVRDNGLGIPAEYHERIFTIFQRLHTRAQYPGTGIGLAICRKIVDQHGGRLWVESEEGKGSTFCFTLPAAEGAGGEPD